MNLMDAVQYLLKLGKRVRHYPNQVRTNHRELQGYEIDNLILTEPTNALNYFRFEYILCAVFSFTTLCATIWFFIIDKTPLYAPQFVVLYYWLMAGMPLHAINVLTKLFIIRRLFKVRPVQTMIARRLMLLVRSNIYLWNERASLPMYNYYIVGIYKLACSNICASMANSLYRLCHFIVCCILLRFANLFGRYLVEHYYLTRDIHYESIINRGASAEEIASLRVEKFYQDKCVDESLGQWCGICLEHFKIGDDIKKLPCAKQHYFHKVCTDTWLRNQNMCPYCRCSLKQPQKPLKDLSSFN